MDFSRLKSSASLSSGEEPSVYLALCMIESLFKDVEEAASCDLSNLPLGDESVSTKLVWLSRKLLKIYKENIGEFSRNRTRLEEMMQQMQAGEATLAESVLISERLRKLQEQKGNLIAELESAKKERARCDELQREVSALEAELEEARAFDINAVQSQIVSLKAECESLRQKRQETESAHCALLSENAALALALEQVDASVASARENASQLREKTARVQSELDDCKANLQAEQQAYLALSAEKEKCYAELGCLNSQKLRAQQQLELFRSQELLPLEAAVQNALQEVSSCKQELSEKQALLETYEKDRDGIILSLAVLMPKLDDAKTALEEKRKELSAAEDKHAEAEAERDAVVCEIKKLTRQLDALQGDILNLRNEALPSAQKHTEAALVSLRQVQDEIAGCEAQTVDLTEKSENLRQKLPPLTEEVNRKNAEYSELTARYTEQSRELSRLQQQLEALRGKNDREKLRRYKEQLNAEIGELSALAGECIAAEVELNTTKEQLRQKEDELAALQEQQNLLRDLQSSVSSRLKELSAAVTKENLRQIDLLRNKVEKMESASQKLAQAQSSMSKTLNTPSLQNASNLSHQIQMVSVSLLELQKALLLCADSIRLEVSE